MNIYKIINIVLFTGAIGSIIFTYWYWDKFCIIGSCTYELTEIYLRPILHGGKGLALILFVLILFPSKLFKYWLYGIFSWGVLLTIYIWSNTSLYATGVLSSTHAQNSILLSYFFGILTACLIVGYYVARWWRERKTGSGG